MARGAVLAGALVLAVAACGGPTPSPAPALIATTSSTPIASPFAALPSASARDLGADLVIVGSGAVPCPIPGCRASVELVSGLSPKASLDPAFQPVGGWTFDLDHATTVGGTAKIGAIRDAPASIPAGTYRVVGAIGIVSDVASGEPDASGRYPLDLLGWDLCEAPLTVSPDVTSVRIDVAFNPKGGCAITTGIAMP
jgi:hypothetical protein